MFRRIVCVLAAVPLLSACAIHPVPEDVTGVDTYHIVRQIRCEARETVKLELIRWLRRLAENPDTRPLPHKLALQAGDLVIRYESDPDALSSFHPEIFRGPENDKVRAFARLFYDTGVAYSFDLTMTEDNDLVAGISVVRPLLESTRTLGIGASAKRKRTNNRTFTVTDTFGRLLTKVNVPVREHRYCDGQLAQSNYMYPIAGRIGLDKLVADFIRLTVFTPLADSKTAPGMPGAPTMADKLTFTTALNGSINPVATFNPVKDAFRITSASATATADRTDTHQVTVALALADPNGVDLPSLRSFLFSSQRDGGQATSRSAERRAPKVETVVGSSVIGRSATPSELLAVMAVDQLKSREVQLIPAP